MLITSDKLVEDIKRASAIPEGGLSNQAILDIVNEEILLNLVPILKSANNEYLVEYVDVDLNNNNEPISIPSDAIANGLREVIGIINGDTYHCSNYNIPQIGINQISNCGYEIAYYFIGNKIQLVSYSANYSPAAISSISKIRLYYERRPSILTSTEFVSNLSSINSTRDSIEINASFTTPPLKVDIIDRDGNLTHSDIDVTVDPNNSLRLNFLTPLETTPKVGSFVSASGTSPIVNGFPQEAMPLLKEFVVFRLMQQIENNPAAKISAERINQLKANLLTLITPRNSGEAKIIRGYY